MIVTCVRTLSNRGKFEVLMDDSFTPYHGADLSFEEFCQYLYPGYKVILELGKFTEYICVPPTEDPHINTGIMSFRIPGQTSSTEILWLANVVSDGLS